MNHKKRSVVIFLTILVAGLVSLSCRAATLFSPTQPATTTADEPAAMLTQPPAASQEAMPPTLPPVTPALRATLDAGNVASQGVALKEQGGKVLESLGDLTRYTIRLDLDYPRHSFSGQAQVDYTNTEDTSLEALNFRLLPNGNKSYGGGSLTVSRTRIEGQDVETELSLNDTVLRVNLPRELEPGDTAQLEFDFQGTVPMDFSGPEERTGYGIYNFSQGVMSLASWYPILAVYDDEGWNLDPVSGIGDSVYSDMAFYSLDVTLPSELTLVATGVPIEQESEEGGLNRYRYVSGPVRDFFLIASPDFQVASRTVEGVKVNSYFLPDHELAGEQALDITVDSLQTFSRRFGPYPYTELDVVDAPMRGAGGVEYPGIFLVASYLYDDPSQTSFTVATAHEVAHQWWYNLVGNDVIDEPWLDEALATYSSALYYEAVQGQGAYRANVEFWQERYQQIVERDEDDLVIEGLAHFENSPQAGSYAGVVYIKGALFLAELREEIGEQTFFDALESYYQEHQYGIAEGPALLEAFEEAAGRELDPLYDRWLYSQRD